MCDTVARISSREDKNYRFRFERVFNFIRTENGGDRNEILNVDKIILRLFWKIEET